MEENFKERIACLEANQRNNIQKIEDLKTADRQIMEDVKEIKENLMGRPSWTVTLVIAGLGSACSIMATFILASNF